MTDWDDGDPGDIDTLADAAYEAADMERKRLRESDRRTFAALTFDDWCRIVDEYRAMQEQLAAVRARQVTR